MDYPKYIPEGVIPDYVGSWIEYIRSGGDYAASAEGDTFELRNQFSFQSQGQCSFSTPYREGAYVSVIPLNIYGGYGYKNGANDYVPYSEILTNIRDMNAGAISSKEFEKVQNCIQSYEHSEEWKTFNRQLVRSLDRAFEEDPLWPDTSDLFVHNLPDYDENDPANVSQHLERYEKLAELVQYAADKIRYHYGFDDTVQVHLVPVNYGASLFLGSRFSGAAVFNYDEAGEPFIVVDYDPDNGFELTTLMEEVQHSVDVSYALASSESLMEINKRIIERNGFDPDFVPSLVEHAGMIGVNLQSYMRVSIWNNRYENQYMEEHAKDIAHYSNPLRKF